MKQLLGIAIFTVIGSSIRQALRRFHPFSNGIAVACKLSWVNLVDSVFYWNLRRLYLVYCLFYFSTRSSSRAMQDARVLFYHDNFKFYSLIGLQRLVFTFSHLWRITYWSFEQSILSLCWKYPFWVPLDPKEWVLENIYGCMFTPQLLRPNYILNKCGQNLQQTCIWDQWKKHVQ